MRRIEKSKKNSIVVPVLIALLAGATISFFIKDMVDKNRSTTKNNVERLTRQADNLLSRFIQLQDLNKSYATMLTDKNLDTAGLKKLNALNILITNNQVDFRKSLDSLQAKKNNYDADSYILLLKITDAYIAALTQSNSINDTRNAINIGNTNYTFDQNLINSMQNELREKQLELINLSEGGKVQPATNYKLMMQQQDSVVNKVLADQKQKNKNLSDYSNKLKLDNDRLTQKLQALQQSNVSTSSNNANFITKTQMNEQLRLAQVDCNLVRADTRKIISNSKQRRELLQEALSILNQLLQSDNPSIKQQAQAKINDLKNIATNIHD